MSTYNQGRTLQNEVLTVREVAAYLRVSRVTVWRWCQQGTIPAARVGRNWRIRRADLLDLLETAPPPGSEPTHLSPTTGADGKTRTLPVIALEKEVAGDCTETDSGSGSESNARRV